MRKRTGLFPYVLGAIWAAFVIFALVEMAGFSATFAPREAAVKATAPVVEARAPRRSM